MTFRFPASLLAIAVFATPAFGAGYRSLDVVNGASITVGQDYVGQAAYVVGEKSDGSLDFIGSAALLMNQNGTGASTGLSAGHVLQILNDPANGYVDSYIGLGDNYLTNPGSIYRIGSSIIHEDWTSLDDFTGDEPDLGGFFLEEFIPGAGSTLSSATLPSNAPVTIAGYGRPALPSGGLSSDGYLRAFTTSNDYIGGAGLATFYSLGTFKPAALDPSPIAGISYFGDSGDLVHDESGFLSGINVGSFNSPLVGGDSVWVRTFEFDGWIRGNGLVPVPEPASLTLMAIASVLLFNRSCRFYTPR